MRGAAVLVAAFVAALALAGCSGKDVPTASGELAGRTEQTFADDPDAAPEGGHGDIRGMVQDDVGLPVADALVSLLGTELSTKAEADGAFAFANVSAGRHTLRVNPPGGVYRVHEGQVDVIAGRVAVVTITLVPKDDRGPGYRPHLHDHWGDATEVVFVDGLYDLSKMGTYAQAYGAAGEVVTGVYEPNNGNWWWYIPPHDERDDGRPPIVLPGTHQVRIEVSWDDAEVDVDAFIVGFTTAASQRYIDQDPIPNGGSRTYTANASEPDNGHQGFSLWQFRMKPAPRTTPMTILGPVHLKVTLVKGDLPVEPSHEDFWNGTSELVLRPYDTVQGVGVRSIGGCAEYANQILLEKGRIVPPGTQALRLRFHWASQTAPNTPDDGVFELRYKPANLRPGWPVDDYAVVEGGRSGTTIAVEVPLQPGETDAFYQSTSNWIFYAHRTDVRGDPAGVCATNSEQGHAFQLEVIALKDPVYT